MKSFEVENLAFNLAIEFRNYYKKYTYQVYRIDNLKQSKWWPHFIKTAEKYIDKKDFDYKFFIEIQFEIYGKVFPYFLPGKKAEAAYNQNYYKENTIDDQLISEVRGSREAVIAWAQKNKKEASDYFNSENVNLFERRVKYLSPYYLAFSKRFLSAYAKLEEEDREYVYSKSELNLKRAYVNQNPVAKREIKKALQEDYI